MRLVTAIKLYASSPDVQTDNAAFVGKKYRVIDHPGYGHVISEHDSTASAKHAALARPYSIVVGPNTTDSFQLQSNQKVRDMVRKKAIQGGGPGSGRHKQILTALGYKYQGQVKQGNIKADLYRHSVSHRQTLVHSSGAWSTKHVGMIDNGTNMKDYYSRYHPSRMDQAIVHGRIQ